MHGSRSGKKAPAGIVHREVRRTRKQRTELQPDFIADEVPVVFAVGDSRFAVMLATPADIDDFALGFCLGEGLIEQPDQLLGSSHRQTLWLNSIQENAP